MNQNALKITLLVLRSINLFMFFSLKKEIPFHHNSARKVLYLFLCLTTLKACYFKLQNYICIVGCRCDLVVSIAEMTANLDTHSDISFDFLIQLHFMIYFSGKVFRWCFGNVSTIYTNAKECKGKKHEDGKEIGGKKGWRIE